MTPFFDATFKCEGEQPVHDIFTMYFIRETKMHKLEEVFEES